MAEIYCIYCGQGKSEGHSVECPIIAGIPKASWGVYPRRGDVEYNLMLGRMGILMKVGPYGQDDDKPEHANMLRIVMPEDPKIWDRLIYEHTAFYIRRIMLQRMDYESEKTKLSDGWLSGRRRRTLDRKLKELEKARDEQREAFKASLDRKPPGSKLSMKSFDQILQTEMVSQTVVVDASGKTFLCHSRIPIFRNSETLELIYFNAEELGNRKVRLS